MVERVVGGCLRVAEPHDRGSRRSATGDLAGLAGLVADTATNVRPEVAGEVAAIEQAARSDLAAVGGRCEVVDLGRPVVRWWREPVGLVERSRVVTVRACSGWSGQ